MTNFYLRYYERHGAFKEATKVMSTLARQEEDLDISTRIKYLIKAVASAEKACNTREYNGGSSLRSLNSLSSVEYKNQTNALSVDTSNKFWVDQLIDLKDTLEIAGNSIYRDIYQHPTLSLVIIPSYCLTNIFSTYCRVSIHDLVKVER